jgi:protein tyrosine/serine phosphatase
MPVDPLTGDDDDVTQLPTPPSKRGFDLHTPEGRRRAFKQLTYDDQGFLRAKFRNFHWVSPEMARANQPSPHRIAEYAGMGFKTIINLRGFNDSGYYLLEREACKAHGLALIDAPFGAREPPYKDRLLRVARLFEEIRYPALMHCKSGADRTGLVAGIWLLLQGRPVEEARAQLSLRHGHIRQSKTGILDAFFAAYAQAAPKPFLDWLREDYDEAALRAGFASRAWADGLVDKILRRE